jgi:hypothetical protein
MKDYFKKDEAISSIKVSFSSLKLYKEKMKCVQPESTYSYNVSIK